MAVLAGRNLIDDINACALDKEQCAFWWLGQHSFVVKLADVVCYVDPFLSRMDRRQVPPLLGPEDITNAAVVLGSHDHADHIDRPVWPGLAQASPNAVFVVPALLRDRIVDEVGLARERVVGVDTDKNTKVEGVTISAVPAAHEFLDTDETTGQHPYVGFVLEGNGVTVYHSGDTCMYEGMQATLRNWCIDVAFVPINGRDAVRFNSGCIGNMTYQEAADLAGAVRPGLTVPAHYEMFANNSENPQLFTDYMAAKYPDLGVAVPEHGERVVVTAQRQT